jgi:hypothetical protein
LAKRGAWFRYGCLGCLGVGGLALLTVLVMAGAAYLTARPAQVEGHVLIPEIPVEVAGEASQGGRIILEIRDAELRLEPAASGEPLRVEARYDVNAFALEDELDPGKEGSAWTYRATFGRGDQAGAFAGLVSLVRGSTARIQVFLPAEVPIDLALDMKGGGAVVRLQGLWLRTAEIDLESGAFDLAVDEPLREPMESLSIRTATGGCLLNGLGNASPRRLDVSYRMGGIEMDLGGRWLTDAEINIRGGMGGGTIHLPSGVIMEGLDLGSIRVPTPLDPEPPTLKFSVSTGMGWLDLSDIHLHDLPPADRPGT